MQILPVGNFKTRFAEVLKKVRQGEEFIISYGRKKDKVAVLIPFERYQQAVVPRKFGILKDKGSFSLSDDFKMSEEEFLRS